MECCLAGCAEPNVWDGLCEAHLIEALNEHCEGLPASESVEFVAMGDSGTYGPVRWLANANAPGYVRCDTCRVQFDLAAGEWPNVPDARGCAHINDRLKGIRA